MKKMILHFFKKAKGWLFLLFLFASLGAYSQTCEVALRNDSLADSKNMYVDIYVKATSGDFYYNSGQYKFTFNTAIKNGGTISAAIVTGSSQLTVLGAVPTATTVGSNYIRVNAMTGQTPQTANPIITASGIGTRICTVKITNTVDFTVGSAAAFALVTTAPGATQVWYSNAAAAATAVTTQTLNVSNLVNPLLNSPIIATYTVGTSGNYCPGDPGLPVTLSSSETSAIRYSLYKNAINAGIPYLVGTGSGLSYGNQTAGTYTVVGNRIATYIVTNMTGSAIITNNPCVTLPTAYAVTGGGSYCQGGAGMPIGIANSQLGVTYTLYLGGAPQVPTYAGTGSAMTFGTFPTAGTYTVSGNNASGTTQMTGNAVITINSAAPASVSIAASANPVCAGTSVTFTPTPTNGGTTPTYVWYKNGSNVGTNGTYNYTPANGDMVYAVMTSNAACVTGSPATSTSITMIVNPVVTPSVTIAASANPVCAGTSVTFTPTPVNGGSTPTYVWYKNGTPIGSNTFTPANGDIVFVAMTSNATCASPSTVNSSDITMVVNPAVPASVSIAPDQNNVCVGAVVTFFTTPTNGGSSPVYTWYINGTSVGLGAAMSYNVANGDQVYAIMTSNAGCVSGSPATSNTVTMIVNPVVAASVTIAASTNNVCAGTSVTFTPTPVGGGATPSYQWFKNGTLAFTGTTYTYTPNNNDAVYAVMTASTTCSTGSPATSNTINMAVNAPVAVSVSVGVSANNICANTSVTFTATPSNGGPTPTYQWFVNATSVGTGATYTYIPVNGDVVYAVMTSNLSCVSASPATSNSITMVVVPTNPTITGPATANAGTTLTYTTESGMTGYTWSVSAGGTIQTGSTTNSITVLWNAGGAQSVSVNYTNSAGCPASTPTVYPVTVTSTPPAAGAVSGSTTVCQGSTGIVYSVTAIPTATGYVWTLPPGATITAGANTNSITVTFSYSATSANVSVYGTNTFGNGPVSPNYTVTVNPAPVPTITGPASVCLNSTGNVYTTQAGMTAYSWTVVGGTITSGGTATSNTATVTWTATGAKTISVSYANGNGCTPATPTVYNVTINALPTPTTTGPASVCQNSTGNVYTTQTGMTGYTWTIVGGTITAGGTATSNTATVTCNTVGAQSISVNYTNANGCTAAAATAYSVTVNALPVPTITGPASVCVNSTGNLYTTQAGMTGYTWTVVGGTITAGGTATSNTATVTWNTVGAKTISVNYTNANSCTAATATVYNVTVNALPVPTITGSASVCLNSTGNVYTTQTGMTGYTWIVVGGTITAGGTATSNTATITWTAAGAKTISVNYTNANGCTAATATVYNVTVNTLPTPTTTGPASVCQNSTGNVYTTQTGMTGYTWTVVGGTITAGGTATSNTATVTWNTVGAQSISVNYANANGCTAATATVYNVTVNALPTPTITGPASVCVNSTGNVYTTQTGMTGYTWTVVGGTITAGGTATSNTATITWTTAGAKTISVNYTNANGCTAAAATVYNVTVNALPVPTITGPTSVCVNSTGNVYTSEAGMTGYAWVVTGGTITAGGTATSNTATITWTTTGAKTISVNYTNANGCTAATATVYNVTVNALPVPTITGSTSACVGTTTNTYTTQTAMTGYTWNISAGGTITAGAGTNAITVTWNATGSQTVSVNYTNANGCTAAAPVVKTITVNALPVPTITGAATACSGTSTTYTTQTGMTGYTWTVSAGGTITAGAGTGTITVLWAAAGTQTVTVNYANANGCTAATPATFTVTVATGASPTITGPASLCAGSTGAVYTTEPGFTNYSWTISYGGTITSTSYTNTVTVSWDNTSGPRTISVNYQNGSGCSAATPTVYHVNVLSLPAPMISGANTVCQGTTGSTYTTQGGMTGYVWTITGGTITAGAGTSAITVNWTGSGAQTISVNYTNSLGCSAVQPVVYNVTVAPKPAAAGVITGPAHVCAPATAQVYTVPSIANANTYNWIVPTGVTIVSGGTTNSITVNFAASATSGVIKVNGVNDCGDGTASTLSVVVAPTPATPTITKHMDTLISSAATGNQWYKDGVLIAGATSKKYVYTQNGTYSVVVTVAGCSSSPSANMLILDVNVDVQVAHNTLDIYPNPNNGEFNIKVETPSKEVYNIEIYNNIGVLVWKQDNVSVDGIYTRQINLQGSPSGVYMIALRNKANSIVKKVIIMN